MKYFPALAACGSETRAAPTPSSPSGPASRRRSRTAPCRAATISTSTRSKIQDPSPESGDNTYLYLYFPAFVHRKFVCHTQLQKSLMRSWEEVGVVWRAVRFGKGKKKIFMLKIFLPKIFSTKIFSPKNIFLMLMNIPKDHSKSQYSETRKPRYLFLKASGRSSQ